MTAGRERYVKKDRVLSKCVPPCLSAVLPKLVHLLLRFSFLSKHLKVFCDSFFFPLRRHLCSLAFHFTFILLHLLRSSHSDLSSSFLLFLFPFFSFFASKKEHHFPLLSSPNRSFGFSFSFFSPVVRIDDFISDPAVPILFGGRKR